MNLQIRAYGAPAPQGSKRIVPTKAGPRLIEGSDQKLRAWRQTVAAAARAAWQAEPHREPIALEVRFWLPRPKTSRLLLPSSRPDLDKLVRAVGDALTRDAHILADDSLIIELQAWKAWAGDEPAGATITLRSAR